MKPRLIIDKSKVNTRNRRRKADINIKSTSSNYVLNSFFYIGLLLIILFTTYILYTKHINKLTKKQKKTQLMNFYNQVYRNV